QTGSVACTTRKRQRFLLQSCSVEPPQRVGRLYGYQKRTDQMFTLLKLELEKLFRSKSFYLSFVILVGFVVLMLWGFYTYAARKAGGQAVEQFKYTYE